MRELNVNEIMDVKGGAAAVLWAILLTSHEALNELGRGIGSGLYDALN